MNKKGRRKYQSELRAQLAEATRARVLDAAIRVAGRRGPGLAVADLPFADVARLASVGERTVYRHFPTQEALGDAVLEVLERRGGSIEPRQAAEIPVQTRRVFRTWWKHLPRPAAAADHEFFRARRTRRRDAIDAALAPLMEGKTPAYKRRAGAVFQALTSGGTYHNLVERCGLDGNQAGEAVAWALDVMVKHLQTEARR